MSTQDPDKQTSVFKSKTSEAYLIKVLAELLTNNLKIGCFLLDAKGIRLTQFDHHRHTLVDMRLDSENFSIYRYKKSEKTQLGLNLNHFHRMLKSIKKKDSLQLFILEGQETELGIKTIPKENNRVTTSGIKIQNMQAPSEYLTLSQFIPTVNNVTREQNLLTFLSIVQMRIQRRTILHNILNSQWNHPLK